MALTDASLPAASTLMGAGAADLVAVAVGAADGRLVELRRRQVLYRPERSLTVRYAAEVDWPGRGRTHETIVAVADRHGPPAGTLVLEADGVQVGIFRYPHDPLLPGLVAATSARHVGELVDRPVAADALAVRAYRPSRRAVVQVGGEDGLGSVDDRYLKVVAPAALDGLVTRFEALGHHVPAPRVVGRADDLGVAVLEALPGTTWRQLLRDRDHALVPGPDEVLAVLDGIGSAPVDQLQAVSSTLGPAATHAELLAAVLPSSRRRFERFVERLGTETPQPVVAVHGDFHPAQLLVTGGVVSGVLDLDDLGAGARVDDLATFLGHVATYGLDDRSSGLRRSTARLLRAFEEVVDPAELHRRVAAVILGLATGPHRVQQEGWRQQSLRRLALAERWLAGDVRSLRAAS